jgi:3-hydroxybutyrate dehydrogenase
MSHGRSAVVTGSTSGIGLAIARSLAKAGYDVTMNGIADEQTIETVCSDIKKDFGVRATFHGANMMKPAEIRELIEHAVKTHGSIDVLVNNAGIQHTASVEEFPDDKWDSIIAINMSSSFHTTKSAVPHMRKSGWGRIINIASVHGLVASSQKSAYVAAKHGVIGLTKVVALETAETKITCNAICPGWVRTPLVEAQIDALAQKSGVSKEQAVLDLLSEKQPSKEFVETSAIGELCVFLCSSAADQITGASFPIDGGWVAR